MFHLLTDSGVAQFSLFAVGSSFVSTQHISDSQSGKVCAFMVQCACLCSLFLDSPIHTYVHI